MPATSIEIEQSLVEKISQRAASRGVSVRAYLEAILERELATPADDEQDQATMRKLEELGYIDAGLDI
jgi:ribosome-binding protein aMBF1 (putative translation factor)